MEQALSRPQYWEPVPSAREYGQIERWIQREAKEMGITPAQFQASMWLGGAEKTGLKSPLEPFMKTFEARVKYTAMRLNKTPQEVLDLFVSGEIPLLSLLAGAGAATGAGVVALGAATDKDRQVEQDRPGL